MSSPKVLYAVYGALPHDKQRAKAHSVRDAVQQLIDGASSQTKPTFKVSNDTLGGDPAPGHGKHFGMMVQYNGRLICAACEEDQTIKLDLSD